KGRLTKPLFKKTRRMKQFVRNYRIEHTHTTFVEHPHDRLLQAQLPSKFSSELFIGGRNFKHLKIPNMTLIVRHFSFGDPLFQTGLKKLIRKIFAPERTVVNSRFGERSVQIQEAHQPWPHTAPIRDGQDRSAMSGKSR